MKTRYKLKKIKGYLLAIADEEMKMGDFVYNSKIDIVYILVSNVTKWDEKVVMHLPLDGNEPFSGLHIMPNLDINIYIDCLYNYMTFNAITKDISYYMDIYNRDKFKDGFMAALELNKSRTDNIYNNYPIPSFFEAKIDIIPIKLSNKEVTHKEGFITEQQDGHNKVVGEYIYNFN